MHDCALKEPPSLDSVQVNENEVVKGKEGINKNIHNEEIFNEDYNQTLFDELDDSNDQQVTDINRVNLMMLLSTLSVVNDNNPNDPYNLAKNNCEVNEDNWEIDEDNTDMHSAIVGNDSEKASVNNWESFL